MKNAEDEVSNWMLFIAAFSISSLCAGGIIMHLLDANYVASLNAKHNAQLNDSFTVQSHMLSSLNACNNQIDGARAFAERAKTEAQTCRQQLSDAGKLQRDTFAANRDVRDALQICEAKLQTINEKAIWADAANTTCADMASLPCKARYHSSNYGLYLPEGKDITICVVDKGALCGKYVAGVYSPQQKMIYCTSDNETCDMRIITHEFCHARQDYEGRKFNEKECG